ncbi:hypothetical protein SO802_003875 [Lithocarpus litseifolius]|uniref:Uncharacterized protein n=1 Tax=Lithocarpus litseifolius TaxID=425828 RepID=A0AAW2E706_9ROSI
MLSRKKLPKRFDEQCATLSNSEERPVEIHSPNFHQTVREEVIFYVKYFPNYDFGGQNLIRHPPQV